MNARRRGTRPGEDASKAEILADGQKGWKKFRETKFQRSFATMHAYCAAPVAAFYVFMDTVLDGAISYSWREFLDHDAVKPLVLTCIAGTAAAVKLMGPIWWGVFWLIVCAFVFGPWIIKLLSF